MLDYQLLDFGHGRKLERFGSVVVDRPEVLASGVPGLSAKEWKAKAHGYFEEDRQAKGTWQHNSGFPETWNVNYKGKRPWRVICKTGPYKHLGIFPEQAWHWKYLDTHLQQGNKYLNLFAYTGAASLVAALAGADVYHVEASKSVVNWAAQNAAGSGIDNIHWVCDDAFKFAEREVSRGRKYHGISLDPPVYGRAKSGVRWLLEDKLEELVGLVGKLLHPGGFMVLNTYTSVVDIASMVKICQKARLKHNEEGWLSVKASDGRALELSKYVVAHAASGTHNT